MSAVPVDQDAEETREWLDALEAEGLVRRVRDPADRRSVLVELTENGRRKHEQAMGIQAQKAMLLATLVLLRKSLRDLEWIAPKLRQLGARHVGIMQSLIVTCRLHQIDPYDYLVDFLQRVDQHPASRVEELIPRRWKQLFAGNPLRSPLHSLQA